MSQFPTVMNLLKGEINVLVQEISSFENEIQMLMKQKEEHEIQIKELQEVIIKLANDGN